jgi:hypothetical protein
LYKKIGVGIIHGIGSQTKDFAEEMETELRDLFAKRLNKIDSSIEHPASLLVIKPIFWAEVLEGPEKKLWGKLHASDIGQNILRKFVIHAFADAIAYQKAPSKKKYYKQIQDTIDKQLLEMAKELRDGEAPLCVIAHSLGSVIASNHFYDLQQGKRSAEDLAHLEHPLARGETLTLFYTMGSPIALWSIGYDDFDSPLLVPTNAIKDRYPDMGEWKNFYDRDDIIGYPLEPLYSSKVVRDHQVNVGNLLTGWNPGSHIGYWVDKDVLKQIVSGLVQTWTEINNITGITQS